MSCSAYFKGDLIKNKRWVRFYKRRDFFISYGVISQCVTPFLHPPKRPSSLLEFGWEDNMPGRSIENWQDVPYSHGRSRMMNTFIIVNITPHVRYSLEDKSMFFQSKKTFHLSLVWPGTEYTWTLIWKKSLLICFESYQGIPYSHTGRVDRNVSTLLMVNINPLCKRSIYSLEDKSMLFSHFYLR